jgi:hypothetical protein
MLMERDERDEALLAVDTQLENICTLADPTLGDCSACWMRRSNPARGFHLNRAKRVYRDRDGLLPNVKSFSFSQSFPSISAL